MEAHKNAKPVDRDLLVSEEVQLVGGVRGPLAHLAVRAQRRRLGGLPEAVLGTELIRRQVERRIYLVH